MDVGCHSMVSPLKLVILKDPLAAFVSKSQIEAEWDTLGFSAPPDLNLATQQFQQLEGFLRDGGVEILHLPGNDHSAKAQWHGSFAEIPQCADLGPAPSVN